MSNIKWHCKSNSRGTTTKSDVEIKINKDKQRDYVAILFRNGVIDDIKTQYLRIGTDSDMIFFMGCEDSAGWSIQTDKHKYGTTKKVQIGSNNDLYKIIMKKNLFGLYDMQIDEDNHLFIQRKREQ